MKKNKIASKLVLISVFVVTLAVSAVETMAWSVEDTGTTPNGSSLV